MSLRPLFLSGLLVFAAGLSAPAPVAAHALLHEVIEVEAVVLRFQFAGGDHPWFEPYEVYAPGVETPFQVGRVNASGELSFRPDRPGAWRVRLFTEDGHGTVVEVTVDESGVTAATGGQHRHAHDHWIRVLAALGYLLGVFGLLVLWRQRKARAAPG